MKKLLQITAFLILTLGFFGVVGGKSHALSGAEFKPGRIIDDSIFTNNTSMTVNQIQLFLESKVAGGSCDVAGTRPSTRWYSAANRYYTHAEWGALSGNPAPYVCLTNYRENPTTKQTNLGNPNVVITGAQTAAEIIYNAGQQYNINPQVLLVLLQKEQSLITDDWPWSSQYSSATGAYCPDTAPCDAAQAGFGTQVREAARLFRYYMNTPFLYFVGNNYVLYNPNRDCGGTNVYIENNATQALYHYTPYQPNAAALTNLYGSGDGCSAYGNRNFWRMFNDWFGSTHGLTRDARLETSTNSSSWLQFNETRTVTVGMRNTGNETWCADGSCPLGGLPTRLVSQNFSSFELYDPSDTSWINSAQIKMQTPTVPTGSIGYFTFRLKAPYINGFAASQRFYIAIASTTFAPAGNIYIGAHVYSSPMFVTEKTVVSNTILPNQTVQATVRIRNDSVDTWYSDAGRTPPQKPFRLMAPSYIPSKYYNASDSAWLSSSQIAMQTPVVAPGQVAVFQFLLKGPFQQLANYDLHLLPVIDGLTFLPDVGIHINISTPSPQLSYEFVSAVYPPATMEKNTVASQKVLLTLKNTSNTVWRNETAGKLNRTRLMMSLPRYRLSAFYDSSDPAWLSPCKKSE